MKRRIIISELINIVKNSIEDDTRYYCWKKFNPNDFNSLKLVGELVSEEVHEVEYKTRINYWNENYPLALSFYPNSGSEIYQENDRFYLIYKEFGGHIPEKRCRLIRKELIVTSPI